MLVDEVTDGGGAGRGGRRRGVKKGQNFSFLELHREGRRARAEQLVFFVIHDVHWGALKDGVLRLGAGEGDEVHIAADSFHLLRGFHCFPRDVPDQVEAYLGSISSTLNEVFGLRFTSRIES